MKDYRNICGWFFMASPSRLHTNFWRGCGCMCGYKGFKTLCKKCINKFEYKKPEEKTE